MEEKTNIEDKTQKKKIRLENVINRIIKIILNMVYVLLGIIVIILIYNIIQITVLNKPYMNIFGYSFFQVKTGSMSGTMEIGDIIVVKLTKDTKKDDIITYEKDNILITHRIVDIQGADIITKGDANNSEDEPISKAEVIGKVVHIFKNVSVWKNVFKSPEVYSLMIITLVLFGITASIEEKKKG